MKSKVSFFKRIKIFMKRNSYNFVISSCVFAILAAVAITAAIKMSQKSNVSNEIPINVENPTEELVPVSAYEPVVFGSPIKSYSIGNGYAESFHVYNTTLKEWSTHLGVDFIAAIDSEVFAVYDGVIESIGTSVLDGTVIVISHGNNLKTVYKSLASEVSVAIGQTVKKGDAIGKVSDSAANESKTGAHLHFEVQENGKNVDPFLYLPSSLK